MLKFITALLLLFTIASCHSDESCGDLSGRQKKIMGDWYMKRINVPPNLHMINAGNTANAVDLYKLDKGKAYIVQYFDATCDKCVDHVKRSNRMLDSIKHQFKDVKYVFIATGVVDVFVKKAIKDAGFAYPMYFENDYLNFRKVNNINTDGTESAYNTMLLDSQYRVLLFGSFYDNEQAFTLYKDIINCN